ncbi:hypothetical protein DVH24_006536, partial [Malus domestica]
DSSHCCRLSQLQQARLLNCANILENRWLGEPQLPPRASELFFLESKECGISDAMFQSDLDMIGRMTKGFLTHES